MNKFCVYCGQELDSGSKFCHNCGAEVTDVVNSNNNLGNNNSVSVEKPFSAEQREVNRIAIVGLVSSILSYFICCGLLSLPSLIFSIAGLSRAKKLGGEGKGYAIIGIILSAIPLVLFIINMLFNFDIVEDNSFYNADVMMRLSSL